MALGKRKPKQASLWVDTSHLRAHGSHPFYRRVNEILERANFDAYVERICRKYYAPTMGRPSIAPGVYFRCFLVGYFEGIDSERGIAYRVADSLSLREFLGLSLEERTPDHSTLSKTRRLQTEAAKARMGRRGERLERSFAHLHETGGMRRVHLRGRNNLAKRLLIHAAAFNLSLILRQMLRAGTARQAAELLSALCLCFLRLTHEANRGPLVIGPRRPIARSAHPLRCRHRSLHRQSEALSTV